MKIIVNIIGVEVRLKQEISAGPALPGARGMSFGPSGTG